MQTHTIEHTMYLSFPLHQPSQGQRRDAERGFTLVELMIVVAMIGVLASLALVGYRKYLGSAKSGEAIAMAQSIRGAQEAIRAETMTYLNVSTAWFPRTSGHNNQKMGWWNDSHPDINAWRTLGVTADGPVRFGYRVNAGNAGSAVSGFTVFYNPAPNWPSPPAEPWYVIQAIGDPDEDSKPNYLVGSSFTGEISYQENLFSPRASSPSSPHDSTGI